MLTPDQARSRWRGVVVPIVTPFAADGDVDHASLASNISWLLGHGARPGNCVLLVAGSGGDWPMMSIDERTAVIETAAEAIDGRLPWIVGGQSLDIRESVRLAKVSESAGADAIQVAAPAYWDGRSRDVAAWLTELASRTSIAFALYNNWYTGYAMKLDLIDELLELPNAVGLKWTAPDPDTHVQGIERWKDRIALIDNSWQTVQGHMHGVRAWVSHFPNFYPEWCWELWDAMEAGRYTEANAEYVRMFLPYLRLTDQVGAGTVGEGVFVRPAMEVRGLNGGSSRLPSRDDAVTPALKLAYHDLFRPEFDRL